MGGKKKKMKKQYFEKKMMFADTWSIKADVNGLVLGNGLVNWVPKMSNFAFIGSKKSHLWPSATIPITL